MPMDFSLIILGVVVILIVLFGVYVLRYRKQRLNSRSIKEIQKLWTPLESLVKDHPDQAILKADKLLDHALKKAGYTGTLGEKLKKARAIFHDLDGLWAAHKLRNRIAHEVHIQVTERQAAHAMKAFKKALNDLGIPL